MKTFKNYLNEQAFKRDEILKEAENKRAQI